MPDYFFDTSAFTKRYHPEPGSARIDELFEDRLSSFRISNLAILETQSAFAMKVRTKVLDQAAAEEAMDKVMNDLESRLVIAVGLRRNHMTNARLLVAKYGYLRRMRTLDALQLSVALDLHRKRLVDVFVVADKLPAEIAVLEGLTVENPELKSD